MAERKGGCCIAIAAGRFPLPLVLGRFNKAQPICIGCAFACGALKDWIRLAHS
jgi:hypothetical protein